MMKYNIFIATLLLPAFLNAQYHQALSQPVSSNASLIEVNHKIILIDPIDVGSGYQKWTTYDSTLSPTKQLMLVTPGAELLINQVYLPGVNSVIRIDQMLIENKIHLGAFIFDTDGNLKHVKALEAQPAPGTALQPSSFYFVQSPDKRSIALMQPQAHKVDSLGIAAIMLDDTLGVVTKAGFTIPYESIISNFEPPLLTNDQQMLFAVADKFDSYKLSTDVNNYVLAKAAQEPRLVKMNLDRKKVKNLKFTIDGDSLIISGHYSNSTNRKNISGIFYGGFDFVTMQNLPNEYYTYTNEAVKSLKKLFGTESRKGDLLNYLMALPADNKNKTIGYAVLLPGKLDEPSKAPAPIPPALAGLGAIRQSINNVNALVGTTANGTNKPMDITEAATYAATMQGGTPAYITNSDDYYSNPSKQSNTTRKQKYFKKNLLYFSFIENGQKYQFAKLKPIQDDAYSFFTYVMEKNGYGALHYHWPSARQVYLNKTIISHTGEVTEQKVFEDKSKVLLADFPFIVSHQKLIAFYEDKFTGEMGLIKIQL